MRLLSLFRGRSIRSLVGSITTVALAGMASPSFGGIVTFGSGSNQFNMEFVTIGNPGNAPDSTGDPNPAGAVGYEYGIGKFEVSEDMITKYNANFGTENGLVISQTNRGANKPATATTWNGAARFVNWLNRSQGYQEAYKFAPSSTISDNIQLWTSGEAGFNASNRYRNSLARYVLPDYNEWYKAAYYKASNSTYYDYANGSDTAPTAVASGVLDNTAVYQDLLADPSVAPSAADVDQAGGLSPYGVMALGGNAQEWEESSFDLANSSGASNRAHRGGAWGFTVDRLKSSDRRSFSPTSTSNFVGFRVVVLSSSAPPAVPEPSMMVIGTLFGLGGLVAKRRMKK